MLKNALKLAVAGTLVMATATAVAAPSPATTTLNVSANVASNCLVTAAPLAFTDYDASAPVDGSANLSVRCSNATPYRIKLGGGTVYPELNFTLPPMLVDRDTMPDVRVWCPMSCPALT